MFWIALELRSSKMGLIFKLSLPVRKIIAFKGDSFAKSGNTEPEKPQTSGLTMSDLWTLKVILQNPMKWTNPAHC